MVITTTAIAFILLSFGIGIFGLHFLRILRKRSSGRRIGSLITSLFLLSALQNGLLGVGALLFTLQPVGLYIVFLASHIILVILSSLSVYTLYYIMFPKKSPLIATVIASIIGIATFLIVLKNHPQPFLTTNNGIDWGMNFKVSLVTFYLLFTYLSCLTYIFYALFRSIKKREIRVVAIIIIFAAVIGIINTFIRLILLQGVAAEIRTGSLDIGTGIIGLMFLTGLIIIPLLLGGVRGLPVSEKEFFKEK